MRPVLKRTHRIGHETPPSRQEPTSPRQPVVEKSKTSQSDQPVSDKPLGEGGLTDSQRSQEEPVQSPEQKLVKRQPNDPTISPPTAQRLPPTILPRPKGLVLKPRPSPKTAKSTQPVVKPSSGLDLGPLIDKKMTFQKVLKGNPDKLTCLLDIGGTTYVVKAGPGYLTLADHLANTDLFNRMGIQGVRAPLSNELSGEFRTALIKQLDSGNSDHQKLLAALGTHDQISTTAPGLGVDSIFDAGRRAQMKTLLEKLEASKDSESAVLALKAELEKGLSVLEKFNIKQKDASLLNHLADPTTRSQAINDLTDILKTPQSQLTVSWMDALSGGPLDTVKNQLKAGISNLEGAETALVNHVKAKDGARALGALAVMDLVCGMDDRILGDKFNGGNFLFDPQKSDFWCVDNAKNPRLALSFKDDASWKSWLEELMTKGEGVTDKGQSLADHIHWAVYTRTTQDQRELSQNVKLSDTEAAETAAGMEQAVTDILKSLLALVNDNGNGLAGAERNRLKDRLAFVDARIKFTDLLDFGEFGTIPTAADPWVGKKLTRIVVGTVLGRTTEQTNAENWKNKARDPNTTDQELENLDATISDYLQNHPNADQRVLKALFAARSERFVRSLKANAAGLKNLPANNKAWGQIDPAVGQGIKNIADQWAAKRRELGDKDGAAAVNTTMTEFALQLSRV